MSKKEYFAYGSNLNFDQMAYRCPEATAVGTAKLDGYELAFRRGYLTVLPKEGASVEGLIWSITDHDESQLDCYEDYPTFYDKETMMVTDADGTPHKIMVYTMNAPYRDQLLPVSSRYNAVVLQGCLDAGISPQQFYDVEGVPFVEAVQLLCEESPMYIPVQHEAVERERPLFRLPNPALNNDRVTRYLLGRGISLPTIRYCIARKILYESAEYHNCVFLGKDAQGEPKYAALRGIYDYGKPFKREAPGSQKQYGFCIPPMQRGTTVAVFEAAIDAMAEMTLCGDAADKYRLSLGGVSSSGKEPLALQEFLRQHPEITTIELRLDNDAKGRMASVGIQNLYREKYQVCDLPPDIENGDYADMAKNNLMARTAAHRAVCR